MNDSRQFDFLSDDRRSPSINRLIEYKLSPDTNENYIHFDGYYYVSDVELPKKCFYTTVLLEPEPYIEEVRKASHSLTYRAIESNFYEIEIYKREKIEDTSEYREIIYCRGSIMRACYYPTYEQKIYFKIIKEFDSFDEYYDRTREVITPEQNHSTTTK